MHVSKCHIAPVERERGICMAFKALWDGRGIRSSCCCFSFKYAHLFTIIWASWLEFFLLICCSACVGIPVFLLILCFSAFTSSLLSLYFHGWFARAVGYTHVLFLSFIHPGRLSSEEVFGFQQNHGFIFFLFNNVMTLLTCSRSHSESAPHFGYVNTAFLAFSGKNPLKHTLPTHSHSHVPNPEIW